MYQMLRLKRLDNEIKGAFLYRINCRIQRCIGSHEDYGCFLVKCADLFQEFDPDIPGMLMSVNTASNRFDCTFLSASLGCPLLTTLQPNLSSNSEADSKDIRLVINDKNCVFLILGFGWRIHFITPCDFGQGYGNC